MQHKIKQTIVIEYESDNVNMLDFLVQELISHIYEQTTGTKIKIEKNIE